MKTSGFMKNVSEELTELGKLRLRPGDVELTLDDLFLTPLFANAPPSVERRLRTLRGKGAAVARRFRAGDTVCRQGEPGWTAFYVLRDVDIERIGLPPISGPVESESRPRLKIPNQVSVTMPMLLLDRSTPVVGHVSVRPSASRAKVQLGFLERVKNQLVRPKRRRSVLIDTSMTLEVGEEGSLVGQVRKGDLFGEMSCFNHTPRSATVRATVDCYMLELVKNVLEDALENDEFKKALDEVYRKRALEIGLREVPIFQDAPIELLQEVTRRAELVRLERDAVLFREGDAPDAMYLVRMGSLKLVRDGRVLAYRSRGDSVGMGSLLANEPRRTTVTAHYAHPESSRGRGSLGARVEVVRISRDLFDDACKMFPAIRAKAGEIAERRSTHATHDLAPSVENHAGSLGLLAAEKLLLIDLERCTRCDDCVAACAATHDDVPLLRREGPRFGHYLVATSCRQCTDPQCLVGCPVGSIHRGSSDEIEIESWCIGCGICAEQCPYDAIAIGKGRRALVCDQCTSLGDGEPMCVHACGHDAAMRVDGRSFFAGWSRPK
ncbi:MAG: cyclic nucleotide-binding domain-containing protein [Deltaproteobacteria bacterium]|nr:cyclic nucleotide-binding domain-containing protein [Deltaproteobacteria bacterium]